MSLGEKIITIHQGDNDDQYRNCLYARHTHTHIQTAIKIKSFRGHKLIQSL